MSATNLTRLGDTAGVPDLEHRFSASSGETAFGKERMQNQTDTTDTPEGGVKGWLTVLGAFLALFCSFGQLNSIGTFQAWYSEHQLSDLPPSTISWIGALQLWVFFFSGGFLGRLFDIYGPRYIMIFGMVVLLASTMLTSICAKFHEYILAQGLLFGLGVGMLFYPSLSAIATHFNETRATAVGLAMVGSGAGGVIYPIMLRDLFPILGFGWTVRVSGFISLALCLVAVATVSSKCSGPKDVGTRLTLAMFTDKPYVLLAIASVFVAVGLFIPYMYIVDYAVAHSVPQLTAFYVLSAMNAGSTVGRILPSYLSDRFGRFNVILPCTLLSGLLPLVFWMFARGLMQIVAFAVLYGFFSGAFNSLVIPCAAQISQQGEYGLRAGMLYSVISFPSLCGGPAAGALLKLQGGGYSAMIALSGSTILLGFLFMLAARCSINSRMCACI